MSIAAKKFLVVKHVHQEQRRKLINKVNKKELLTIPPGNGVKILIELEPAHSKYRILGIQNRLVTAHCYHYSEWLCGS